MISFFVYYLMALLIGGLAITGWFNVTRGKWEVLPNGHKVWKGKLFSGWQRFWEQETCMKKVYYAGDQLRNLMAAIEPVFGLTNTKSQVGAKTYGHTYQFSESAMCLVVDIETKVKIVERFFIYKAGNPNMGILVKEHQGEYYIFFYKTIKNYFFPEWVRMPLASCIHCFSSIYGTLAWFILVALTNHTHSAYGTENIPTVISVTLWLPYILSLSFLNAYLWQKLK